MKIRSFALILVAVVLVAAWCTGCGNEPQPTVIPGSSGTTTASPITPPSQPETPVVTTPSQGLTTLSPTETTTPTTLPTVPASGNDTGRAIAQLALSLNGAPFKSGSSGPETFDNPGFVVYCYKQNGFTVPRKVANMATFGKEVAWDALQPGDILIFSHEVGGDPGFCTIYLGDNQFIACNNPQDNTRIQKLNISYWKDRFITARRGE